jgi:peptide-methionine (S)-S-oxide reductase
MITTFGRSVCLYIVSAAALSFSACSNAQIRNDKSMENTQQLPRTEAPIINDTTETATLGAGCFWCVEAVFQNLNGVAKVESGYSGGFVKNPSYKEVCAGRTDHAEVVQVTFDPRVIGFADILVVFFGTHDPTTPNQQGADIGTQYRSAIFYHNDTQKDIAEKAVAAANASGDFDNQVITEVTAFTNYYPAEDYHQNYFALNGDQPYCRAVIAPKLEKFKKNFKERLK